MKNILLLFSSVFLSFNIIAQTSWKGTTSTDWQVASNWTAGIPTSTVDAIIGDANFTGAFQPILTGTSAACKSLTIGTGSIVSSLSITRNLDVNGNITIGNNGTIMNNTNSYIITLKGNWTNTGNYTSTASTASITFSGTTQNISGVSTFKGITINSGSTVSLANNITVNGALSISGTFDPTELYTVSGTGTMSINSGGIILVKTATFAGNYMLSGSISINGRGTVNYASSTINQTISNAYSYGYLRISGGSIKTLAGNLPNLNSGSTNNGRIYIDAGTLDLSTFTANRSAGAGGFFTIAANATLKIGGTNSFPSNYSTVTIASTSHVYYYGNNQTVPDYNYGNLYFESTSGVATKTMPSSNITIAGNFTCNAGSGTGITFTALSKITVNKNVILNTGTTFNASSYSHIFRGNWTNNGTLNGNTSTISFKGTNAILSGTGTNNFNNLAFTAAGITANGTTALTISGNISTSGAGIFTHGINGTCTLAGTSKNISGNGLKFYNCIISGTYSTSKQFSITGDFTVNGSFVGNTNSTVTMNGTSKSMNGSGSITFATFKIFGTISTIKSHTINTALTVSSAGSYTATTGATTMNGSPTTLSGTANLYDVIISSGKTLRMGSSSVLGIANVFTKSGSLDVTTNTPNTVDYNATGAQTVVSTTYNNLTLSNGGNKTPSAAITVNNDFLINTGVVFIASTFTHAMNRHITNNGTFTAGTSTIQMNGANAANIIGTITFNNLTVNKNSNVISVNLFDNVSTSSIAMTTGNMQTGSNSITITSTRSGNGIIIGTIIRNHTFNNGTTYYFEGPQNAITFNAPSGINSVTVKVSLGTIVDFDPSVECVNREYEITIPAGTYTNATLRYHYEDNELNAFSEPFLSLYKFNSGILWDSLGFTSRNTTSNYVELTGITALQGRYTGSGVRNIIRWDGSVSTAWENAGNWTTYSGADMSNRIPTATDGVDFGSAAFTNQPTLSSSRQVALVRFGSTQSTTITIASSGTLACLGSTRGVWSTNRSHTIDAGAGIFTVGTNLDLSDGTNNHDITLNIGNGSASISNNLNQNGTGAIVFTGNGTLNLSGNYNYTAGTFTPSSGTTNYTGAEAQIVAPITYNNLSFTKSTDRAYINSAIIVNGNFTTTTGGEIEANANITVAGNISIGAGTTLIENGTIINVGGNWTRTGSFLVSTGEVNFNGSSAQAVNANTFNNLTVNKSAGTLSFSADNIINGDLTLTNGTLDLLTFLADRSNPGGTLTIGATSLLKLSGSSNFPRYYSSDILNSTSTVEYYGSTTQDVLDITYGNLIFTNGTSNAKILLGDITINGDLLINSNATIDPDSTTIILNGNFTNNGTFSPSGSTLILNGNTKTFTGTTTLYDLSVITGSYTVSAGTISIEGDFTIDSLGTFNFGSNNVSLDGDLTNKGSLTSNGTATFTGTRVQTLQLLNAISSSSTGIINFNGTVAPILNSTSSPSFATVNINNTAGVSPSVPWTVFFACNIASGASFNGGALTHTFYGNFTNNGTVTSSGELKFTPTAPFSSGATIRLDGTAFTSTGRVTFGGSSSITILNTNPSFHEVYVTNTNVAGISPPSNWTIDQELYIGPGATFKGGTNLSHTINNNYTNNGTLNGETSTFSFYGNPVSIEGIGLCTFHNLTFATGSNITLNKPICISKDLIANGLFTGTGRVVKFTGSTASTISGTTSPLIIDDLEQDKTSTTTSLLIPVEVTSNFTLTNGIFNTSSTNLLTLTDGAISTSGTANSYVDGPMKKIGDDAFVFPLGDGNYWARLGISAPSTSTDAFTAEYIATAYTNTTSMASSPTPILNNVSQIEYWTCDRTNGTSDVTVQLYWENATRSGIQNYSSDLVVAHWNGSAWENAGQSTITASNPGDVTSLTQNSFSPFTFGSILGMSPLPIEMIDFNAQLNESMQSEITWTTASEINNDYFIVEKSENALSFESLRLIDGAGTSTTTLNYSTIDENPYENITYYRLKQVDYNGDVSYSKIISVEQNSLSNGVITLFPNPSSDGTFNIGINTTEGEEILVVLYNISGQTVYSKVIVSSANRTIIAIDPLEKLASGIYWVIGSSNNELFRKKLIVK